MESIVETFHLDVKLLIAQMVNFAIVFFVLYYFLLRPLLKVMGERSKKIEKGLEDAELFKQKILDAENDYLEKIKEAKKEALGILQDAKNEGEEKRKVQIEKTREEMQAMVVQGKEKLREQKKIILKEIREDVSDLVMAAVEKVMEEKLSKDKDSEMIKRAISKIK